MLQLEAKVTEKIYAHNLECMRFVLLLKQQPAWATMQWTTMLATCRTFTDGIGLEVSQSKAASVWVLDIQLILIMFACYCFALLDVIALKNAHCQICERYGC